MTNTPDRRPGPRARSQTHPHVRLGGHPGSEGAVGCDTDWLFCATRRGDLTNLNEIPIRRSEIVRANYNLPAATLRNHEER